MVQKAVRALIVALATISRQDPNQQTAVTVLTAFGIIAWGAFVATMAQYLAGTLSPQGWRFWLVVIVFPVIALGLTAYILTGWIRQSRCVVLPPPTTRQPAPSAGLILLLSTFRVFEPMLRQNYPQKAAQKIWATEDLIAAVNANPPNWTDILDYVSVSNMQLQLEAILYHHRHGALRHVWVIATADMPNRPGSRRLVEAFQKIVHEVASSAVTLHHHRNSNGLLVAPFSVQETFVEVGRIYRDEVRMAGLREEDVIGDITGGVTMSTGMVLACGLSGRRLQFMASEYDPNEGHSLQRPTPFAVEFNEALLRQWFLRRLAEQESGIGGRSP